MGKKRLTSSKSVFENLDLSKINDNIYSGKFLESDLAEWCAQKFINYLLQKEDDQTSTSSEEIKKNYSELFGYLKYLFFSYFLLKPDYYRFFDEIKSNLSDISALANRFFVSLKENIELSSKEPLKNNALDIAKKIEKWTDENLKEYLPVWNEKKSTRLSLKVPPDFLDNNSQYRQEISQLKSSLNNDRQTNLLALTIGKALFKKFSLGSLPQEYLSKIIGPFIIINKDNKQTEKHVVDNDKISCTLLGNTDIILDTQILDLFKKQIKFALDSTRKKERKKESCISECLKELIAISNLNNNQKFQATLDLLSNIVTYNDNSKSRFILSRHKTREKQLTEIKDHAFKVLDEGTLKNRLNLAAELQNLKNQTQPKNNWWNRWFPSFLRRKSDLYLTLSNSTAHLQNENIKRLDYLLNTEGTSEELNQINSIDDLNLLFGQTNFHQIIKMIKDFFYNENKEKKAATLRRMPSLENIHEFVKKLNTTNQNNDELSKIDALFEGLKLLQEKMKTENQIISDKTLQTELNEIFNLSTTKGKTIPIFKGKRGFDLIISRLEIFIKEQGIKYLIDNGFLSEVFISNILPRDFGNIASNEYKENKFSNAMSNGIISWIKNRIQTIYYDPSDENLLEFQKDINGFLGNELVAKYFIKNNLEIEFDKILNEYSKEYISAASKNFSAFIQKLNRIYIFQIQVPVEPMGDSKSYSIKAQNYPSENNLEVFLKNILNDGIDRAIANNTMDALEKHIHDLNKALKLDNMLLRRFISKKEIEEGLNKLYRSYGELIVSSVKKILHQAYKISDTTNLSKEESDNDENLDEILGSSILSNSSETSVLETKQKIEVETDLRNIQKEINAFLSSRSLISNLVGKVIKLETTEKDINLKTNLHQAVDAFFSQYLIDRLESESVDRLESESESVNFLLDLLEGKKIFSVADKEYPYSEGENPFSQPALLKIIDEKFQSYLENKASSDGIEEIKSTLNTLKNLGKINSVLFQKAIKPDAETINLICSKYIGFLEETSQKNELLPFSFGEIIFGTEEQIQAWKEQWHQGEAERVTNYLIQKLKDPEIIFKEDEHFSDKFEQFIQLKSLSKDEGIQKTLIHCLAQCFDTLSLQIKTLKSKDNRENFENINKAIQRLKQIHDKIVNNKSAVSDLSKKINLNTKLTIDEFLLELYGNSELFLFERKNYYSSNLKFLEIFGDEKDKGEFNQRLNIIFYAKYLPSQVQATTFRGKELFELSKNVQEYQKLKKNVEEKFSNQNFFVNSNKEGLEKEQYKKQSQIQWVQMSLEKQFFYFYLDWINEITVPITTQEDETNPRKAIKATTKDNLIKIKADLLNDPNSFNIKSLKTKLEELPAKDEHIKSNQSYDSLLERVNCAISAVETNSSVKSNDNLISQKENYILALVKYKKFKLALSELAVLQTYATNDLSKEFYSQLLMINFKALLLNLQNDPNSVTTSDFLEITFKDTISLNENDKQVLLDLSNELLNTKPSFAYTNTEIAKFIKLEKISSEQYSSLKKDLDTFINVKQPLFSWDDYLQQYFIYYDIENEKRNVSAYEKAKSKLKWNKDSKVAVLSPVFDLSNFGSEKAELLIKSYFSSPKLYEKLKEYINALIEQVKNNKDYSEIHDVATKFSENFLKNQNNLDPNALLKELYILNGIVKIHAQLINRDFISNILKPFDSMILAAQNISKFDNSDDNYRKVAAFSKTFIEAEKKIRTRSLILNLSKEKLENYFQKESYSSETREILLYLSRALIDNYHKNFPSSNDAEKRKLFDRLAKYPGGNELFVLNAKKEFENSTNHDPKQFAESVFFTSIQKSSAHGISLPLRSLSFSYGELLLNQPNEVSAFINHLNISIISNHLDRFRNLPDDSAISLLTALFNKTSEYFKSSIMKEHLQTQFDNLFSIKALIETRTKDNKILNPLQNKMDALQQDFLLASPKNIIENAKIRKSDNITTFKTRKKPNNTPEIRSLELTISPRGKQQK